MKPEALLVIDVQYGFMHKGADRVVEPIAALAKSWPADKLFYLKYRNYPGSLYTKHLDWHEFITSEETAIVTDVLVPDAKVFDHFGYRPPDELITQLKKFSSVGICGADTDACVMSAVFALWDAEIRPLILADYCASSGGEQFHRAALDLMLRQFGTSSVIRGTVKA